MLDDIVSFGKTDCGEYCITRFGLGLKFGGKFTSAAILKGCADALIQVPEDSRVAPYWFESFNDYTWVLWERMTEKYANAIQQRLRISTRNSISLDTSDNYLGYGRYQDCWSSYISTSDRMLALTKTFHEVSGIRLLELGCGTGNQLISLAAYDIDVYGIELNPRLYAERHKLLQDQIVFGDALIDPWLVFKPGQFDAIIVSMLGFVDYSDLDSLFTGLHYILTHNGVLILDVFKTESSGNILPPTVYKNVLSGSGFVPKVITREPQQLICRKEA